MNLKNPINEFKSMLEAEQKVKSLEAELNIRNKTCEERGLVIDKLKEDIKTLKEEIKSLKIKREYTSNCNKDLREKVKELKKKIRYEEFDKETSEKKLDYLNYLICRCCDIDFYSNVAVFQSKFDRGSNWRHPIITEYENIEQFQKNYLFEINDHAVTLRKFIEELYADELNKFQEFVNKELDLDKPEKNSEICEVEE